MNADFPLAPAETGDLLAGLGAMLFELYRAERAALAVLAENVT